ncbi:MAG TPA: HNH endonuclease [Blastocatellia bacterium]|nr:HNH endonuclease [Blastocatellia bacterium]
MPRIPQVLRGQSIRAANNRCEYCLTLQEMTLATFHVDHIIPKSAGGVTEFENLCLSCPFCNQYKKHRVRARDPKTGRRVQLFNPRRDPWHKHFAWSRNGTRIIGLTARGRATVEALRMNNPISLTARSFWVASRIHPPKL